jgi:hypothetical protein
MGYSEDAHMVRVDFFKSSGKWYVTEAIKWLQYNARETPDSKIVSIYDAFKNSLMEALYSDLTKKVRLAAMTAVCLDPYYEHACPVLMKVPGCGWCQRLECEDSTGCLYNLSRR